MFKNSFSIGTFIFKATWRGILSLQFVFGLNLSAGRAATISDSGLDVYHVPPELRQELEYAPVGTVFIASKDGKLFKGYFLGLYDWSANAPCVVISDTCWPRAQMKSLGAAPVELRDGSYKIIEPGQPGNEETLVTPQKLANDARPSDSLGPNETPSTESSFDVSNSELLQKTASIAWSVGSAALTAGVSSSLINMYGAEAFDAANGRLALAGQRYDQAVQGNQILGRATQAEVFRLARELQLIRHIGSTRSVRAVNFQPDDLSIPIDDLNDHLKSFDSLYQTKVLQTTSRLNQALFVNTETYYAFKKIGREAVRSSLESRTEGFIDISNAQLEIASRVADLLYGIDPITAIHRGIYEAFTGKNLITDRQLTTFERSLSTANAVLGLSTLGLLPGVIRGIKAISMITRAGFGADAVLARQCTKSAETIAEGIVHAGISTKTEQKAAEVFLRKEITAGGMTEASQVEGEIAQAIREGEIPKARFRPEFRLNPSSQESLKYITDHVSSEGLRAGTIFPGNTNEIYLIGRRMGKVEGGKVIEPGVRSFKQALIHAGYDKSKIHLFELSPKAWDELAGASRRFRRDLSIEELRVEAPLSVKENTSYMERAIGTPGQRPTIIETMRIDPSHSAFYDDLERVMIKASGR